MSTVAATAGGKAKPQKIEDFMPGVWDGAKKPVSTNEDSLGSFANWAKKYQ